MKAITLDPVKILGNITEGYNVTLTRNDGFECIIIMEYRNGEEVFIYKFEHNDLKREFKSLEHLIRELRVFKFVSVEY